MFYQSNEKQLVHLGWGGGLGCNSTLALSLAPNNEVGGIYISPGKRSSQESPPLVQGHSAAGDGTSPGNRVFADVTGSAESTYCIGAGALSNGMASFCTGIGDSRYKTHWGEAE